MMKELLVLWRKEVSADVYASGVINQSQLFSPSQS